MTRQAETTAAGKEPATIRMAGPGDGERWDSFVQTCADGSCYHLWGWKNVVEKSFGHRTYYLMAEGPEGIMAILPLVHLKSRLFGSFFVSLPFFNYGGLCGDATAGLSLLEEAARLARGAGASHMEMRHDRALDLGLPVKTAKVSMRLSLPNTAVALWDGLPSKLKSQIRRPQKEGFTTGRGREENLDAFYEVFAANMRDLGTPVYARSFFRAILEAFPQQTWIRTVRATDGTPLAAGFFVSFRGILEIPWASSLRRWSRHSPNMLLYWGALEEACTGGYQTFDFGRSTPGEGTFRFKEQWGARPHPLYWHYWLKDGGLLPELNPHNPRYRMAINSWRRLPLAITKIIGPSIVRNLP